VQGAIDHVDVAGIWPRNLGLGGIITTGFQEYGAERDVNKIPVFNSDILSARWNFESSESIITLVVARVKVKVSLVNNVTIVIYDPTVDSLPVTIVYCV
jgi:hypothetical protein